MSMNYFAFFPALVNEATNPNAKPIPASSPTRPARAATSSPRSAARASRSSPTRQNKEEAMKFLEWFIKDETQKTWAELGGYTCCSRRSCESDEFQNATPYNKAFYETMFKVKDFWALPEYAELLIQMQPARLSVHRRRQGHGAGNARHAGGRLERDLQEVRPANVGRVDPRERTLRGAAAIASPGITFSRGSSALTTHDDDARSAIARGRRADGATSRSATCSSSRRSCS